MTGRKKPRCAGAGDLHTEVFDVLYDGEEDAVLVRLDVELRGQHASDLVEALLCSLAPALLYLRYNASQMAQEGGDTSQDFVRRHKNALKIKNINNNNI